MIKVGLLTPLFFGVSSSLKWYPGKRTSSFHHRRHASLSLGSTILDALRAVVVVEVVADFRHGSLWVSFLVVNSHNQFRIRPQVSLLSQRLYPLLLKGFVKRLPRSSNRCLRVSRESRSSCSFGYLCPKLMLCAANLAILRAFFALRSPSSVAGKSTG